MRSFLFLKRFLRPRQAKTIIAKSGIFKGQEVYPLRKAKVNIDEKSPFVKAKNEGIAEMMRNCPIPEHILKWSEGRD